MSSPSPHVWFLLFDSATGEPYKGTSADLVSLPPGFVIDQFRDAVQLKYDKPNYLKDIPSSALLVYKNKSAFVEGKADPTESLGLLGSKEDMLIVVVPSSATYSSSRIFINTRIDGIALGTEHLKRNELLGKLQSLYQAAYKNITVVGISFLEEKKPFDLLSEAGIDIRQKKISKNLSDKAVVVFVDDAQKKFGDAQFWESLVKGTGIWIPENIKFIISATHSLSGGKESPVEFASLPRLSRMDFLLTDEEAYELLEFRDTGLPANIRQHRILKDFLVKECGGLVGALRLSIDALERNFFLTKNDDVEESSCIGYCLSDAFVQYMARCFGSAHSYPAGNDFKRFLKFCFENEKARVVDFTNPQDYDSYSSLKKAGILVELSDSSFGFSSPLAKRYYFKWIFPNRSQTEPASPQELVLKVVSNMSSTVLKNSTLPGNFPKEAVFQHLFMEGLALYTPPDCSICPDLSKIFPIDTNLNSQPAIGGEIDFYLNGKLRWGIELLVNGNGIGEHFSRFCPQNGKYAALAVKDYVIVDFRRTPTGQPTKISKYSKRVTVFFKNDDYSVAKCLFGEDTAAIEISLAN